MKAQQPLRIPAKRPTLLQVERSQSTSPEGRIPPQAVDIEAQVLGAMLVEREAIYKVTETLKPHHFYADHHKKIYEAILRLFEDSVQVDLITVADELRKSGHLELVGGETYLAGLSMNVVSGWNVEFHAKIVLEKALLRGLITASSNIINRAYSTNEDALVLVAEAQTTIFEIGAHTVKKRFISARQGVIEAIDSLEKINGVKEGLTGIPSGFKDLDELTTGWQDTDLIVIGGRPSHGKTSFALNLARHAAGMENPIPVGIFSLEMSTKQLIIRLLCSEGKINGQNARKGRLTPEEWDRVTQAAAKISTLGIHIDDSQGLDLLELRSKALRLRAERKVGMIVIDYMQLMSGAKEARTREQEISGISRGLKGLAKELNIPVIALSQLSRETEKRKGAKMRPILSDLRESGAIEQDSDVVLFVHRPEMYYDKDEYKGLAEIIVAKQRNGPLDIVKLAFNAGRSTFSNLSHRTTDGKAAQTGNEDALPF
jgi:replicative DNA helicase